MNLHVRYWRCCMFAWYVDDCCAVSHSTNGDEALKVGRCVGAHARTQLHVDEQHVEARLARIPQCLSLDGAESCKERILIPPTLKAISAAYHHQQQHRRTSTYRVHHVTATAALIEARCRTSHTRHHNMHRTHHRISHRVERQTLAPVSYTARSTITHVHGCA